MARLGARRLSGLDAPGLPCDGRLALRRVRQEPSARPGASPSSSPLALVRVSDGHKRLHVLLRREGWTINHKRTRRLYREEGLQLGRYCGPKRRKRVGVGRGLPVRVPAKQPNVRWAMDFVHDQTASGTAFRVLTVIDVFSRECVALVARWQFRGDDVAAVLTSLLEQQGGPTTIQCDQGTEFTRWRWTPGRTGSTFPWTSVAGPRRAIMR
jgi:putative transposase